MKMLYVVNVILDSYYIIWLVLVFHDIGKRLSIVTCSVNQALLPM